MAKNIEINILTDDTNKTYEILYPKVDLTNNQGTALPIDSTSGSISITDRTTGNLPSSRLSAGTLSGSFTFTTPPYCSTSPSSSYYLANKAYVDSVANSGGNYVQYKTGTRTGNGSLSYTIYVGFSVLLYFMHFKDEGYNSMKTYIDEETTTTGGTSSNDLYFNASDSNPFFLNFSSNITEGPNTGVYNINASTTGSNSSLQSTKLFFVDTSYSGGTLTITYGGEYQQPLTFNNGRVPYNRTGTTYNWIAFGY